MHIQSLTCQSRGFSFPAPLRDRGTRESAFPPNQNRSASTLGEPARAPSPPRSLLKAQDNLRSHRALPSTRDLEPLPVREKLK